MKINHHPEDATLAAYAAASLPTAMALVVGCHLEFCSQCRHKVQKAEQVGGVLLDGLPGKAPSAQARTAMLERLDEELPAETAAPATADKPSVNSDLPAKLQALLGDKKLADYQWRSAGPGVKLLKLDCGEGNMVLLDIAPNHTVPVHSHKGTELTLILRGYYTDKLGHFASGDVADLDDRVQHQPAAGPEGCLCLAGLDAPLRYKDLLPRLFQPLFGL